MLNILFLCTGNSCRSQMAEGFARDLKSSKYKFYSAGTKKHGMNSNAVEVMSEVGIDLNQHYSKTTEELDDVKFDYIFTVCADASENCPVFHEGKVIHKGFDDPPRMVVNLMKDEEILEVYRRVRDEIKDFVNQIEIYL